MFEQDDDPIFTGLTIARMDMLRNHPFFGVLAMRMPMVDVTGAKWLSTLATDGRRIYYNRDFIKSLTRDELKFVIGHEVLHVVYDHMERTGDRNKEISNMAQDYLINYVLVEQGLGVLPKQGLYSKEFTDELISEEIYDILISRCVSVQATLDQHLEPEPEDSEGEGGGEGDKDKDGKDKDDKDKDGKPRNKKDSGYRQGTVDSPPVVSQTELTRIRNEIKAAVISAAQQAGAGEVPEGIMRLIGDMTEPKIDWREYLECFIQTCLKDDWCYQRLSRRSFSTNVLLPGQRDAEEVEVSVAIDTSGSMSNDMLQDFLGEVKGVMDQFPSFKLRLWTFDTDIYGYKIFTPENIDEIYEYKMLGGGGTDFMVNWKFMRDPERYIKDSNEVDLSTIEPERLLFFTDGYPCGNWGESEYCTTLFVIHGDFRGTPPFGEVVYYEEA